MSDSFGNMNLEELDAPELRKLVLELREYARAQQGEINALRLKLRETENTFDNILDGFITRLQYLFDTVSERPRTH